MKKRGFTLAEVLISLGIIGVVSAITMPALTANYQKKTYEASVKKTYNTVSVAIQTYMANEGIDNLLDSDLLAANTRTLLDQRAKEFAEQYFKVAQDCGTKYYAANGPKCFAKSYKRLNRKDGWDYTVKTNLNCNSSVTLTDGTAMCIAINPGDATEKNAFAIEVDTNGVNGPNITGRDMFHFDISSTGIVYDADWDEHKNETVDEWKANFANHNGSMHIGRLMADGWQMLY